MYLEDLAKLGFSNSPLGMALSLLSGIANKSGGGIDTTGDATATNTGNADTTTTNAGNLDTTETRGTVDQYTFNNFQEALKYQVASSLAKQEGAWDLFKDEYLPYQQKTLNAIQGGAANQGYAGINDVLSTLFSEAGGYNLKDQMGMATADVNQSFNESAGTMRRNAAKYGIDQTDDNFVKSMSKMAYEKAKAVGSARNTEAANFETDQLQRLAAASGAGLSAFTSISNPADIAKQYAGIAEQAATSGYNQQVSKSLSKESGGSALSSIMDLGNPVKLFKKIF